MIYRCLPAKTSLGEVIITGDEKEYQERKRDTVHFDSKQNKHFATPLCGLCAIYSLYSIDVEDITCKRCIKKISKNHK